MAEETSSISQNEKPAPKPVEKPVLVRELTPNDVFTESKKSIKPKK